MATIRPVDLPAAASVNPAAVLVVDDGATVEKATPIQVVDAAIPLASQAEAEAGVNNAKRVSPLRVKQAIDALGVSADALASEDPPGSLLIMHKSAMASTYARTLRQWAVVGGLADNNVFNWIDSDLDPGVLDGTNATPLTASLQAGWDELLGGLGELNFHFGTFLIDGSIQNTATTSYGKKVRAASRGSAGAGAMIVQAADNTPIFEGPEVNLQHTWDWSDLCLTWANPQTGNTDAWVFDWTGDNVGAEDVYECTFERMFVSNCYGFMRGTDINFWGNMVRGVWCQTNGGFTVFDGNGGMPKVKWDGMYITGGAPGHYLFDHSGMNSKIWAEVNGTSSMLLREWGGGYNFIEHFALETTNYSGLDYVGGDDLFSLLNSVLICPYQIYARNMTVSDGMNLGAFRTSGTRGHVNVETFDHDFLSQPAGTKFTVLRGAGSPRSRVGKPTGSFTAPGADPVRQLTDVPSSAACNSVTVTEWADPLRVLEGGDGTVEVTLGYDSPSRVRFGTPLAAPAVVRLPRHNAVVGNNLFAGRYFTGEKLANAGTVHPITFIDYAGNTVFTIPAATVSGSKAVGWDRTSPTGAGSAGYWTEKPLPV